MKLKIEVNKLANQYFFISSLSCWHKSCRVLYNKEWLKDNPLTDLEKEALLNFSRIHQKYSFSDGSYYLGKAFFLYNNPWEEIKKKTEYHNQIKNIFGLFEPRFLAIWEDSFPKLNKQQTNIENFFLHHKAIVSDIDKHLLNFFSLDRPIVDQARVILLLSADGCAGGGANIKPDGVTLEVSGWHKEDNKIISILYHELVHLCYENYKMLPKDYPHVDSSIREAIIAGLFPNGYLANKYLQIKSTNKFSNILKEYITDFKHLDLKAIDLIKKEVAL